MYFSGGLFNGSCDPNGINHAMVAVGYGTMSDGQQYAIVRNSWGTGWGDGGYVNIAMGPNDGYGGLCAMYEWAHYPLMA